MSKKKKKKKASGKEKTQNKTTPNKANKDKQAPEAEKQQDENAPVLSEADKEDKSFRTGRTERKIFRIGLFMWPLLSGAATAGILYEKFTTQALLLGLVAVVLPTWFFHFLAQRAEGSLMITSKGLLLHRRNKKQEILWGQIESVDAPKLKASTGNLGERAVANALIQLAADAWQVRIKVKDKWSPIELRGAEFYEHEAAKLALGSALKRFF